MNIAIDYGNSSAKVGVFDGRKAMRDYLHAVQKYLKSDAKGVAPSVPKVVTC